MDLVTFGEKYLHDGRAVANQFSRLYQPFGQIGIACNLAVKNTEAVAKVGQREIGEIARTSSSIGRVLGDLY